MKISTILSKLLALLGLAPHYIVGEGEGTSAEPDRGDDFTPTDDDAGGKDDKDEGDESEGGTTDKTEKVEKAEKPEKADKTDKTEKPKSIPLDRHEAVLRREREQRQALEQQLADARGAKQLASTNERISELDAEITKMEGEYTKALIDGDTREAQRLMAKIRSTEREASAARTQFETQAAEARAYARARYDAVVDRLEDAYPQLREGSDEYDKDLVSDITAMSTGLQARGLSPVDALQAAVKRLIAPSTAKQETAVEKDVRITSKDVAEQLAKDRKADAVKRNVKDAERTPGDLSKLGMDNDKAGGRLDGKAIARMSQEQFAKLDDETLSKLRGDTL